jgi:hypothetical protein
MLREIGAKALAATGESTLRAVDYMDDGSKINLKISIAVDEGKAGNNSSLLKQFINFEFYLENLWLD